MIGQVFLKKVLSLTGHVVASGRKNNPNPGPLSGFHARREDRLAIRVGGRSVAAEEETRNRHGRGEDRRPTFGKEKDEAHGNLFRRPGDPQWDPRLCDSSLRMICLFEGYELYRGDESAMGLDGRVRRGSKHHMIICNRIRSVKCGGNRDRKKTQK
jgi:hypothetical protein